MKGTDLFLQVLTDRLGLNAPQAAAPAVERRGPSRATVVVGGLAAGVLLSSLCSGQTLPAAEAPAPAAPAAAAPAAVAAPASAAPAEAPAPAPAAAAPAAAPAAAAPAAAPAVKTWTRPAASAARTWKPAARSGNRAAAASSASSRAVAPATAAPQTAAAPMAVKPAAPVRAAAASTARAGAVDPESLPIEAYRVPKAQQARGGNLFFDVFGKLIVVIGLMFGCAAGWRKLQGMQGLPGLKGLVPGVSDPPEAQLQVVETYSLAPQRQLHLVRVSGHRLLVGSTPQSVSLIADLDAPRPEPVPVAVSIPVTQPEPDPAPAPEPEVEAARPEVSRYEQIMHLLREQGVEIPAEAAHQPEAPARPAASGLFGPANESPARPLGSSLFNTGSAAGAHRG